MKKYNNKITVYILLTVALIFILSIWSHPGFSQGAETQKKDAWEDFKKVYYKYRELVDPGHSSPHIDDSK